MNRLKISAIAVMAVFYAAYFLKILMQRKKGVQTDQIAKGNKADGLFYIELIMKIATYTVVPVELISIIGEFYMWGFPFNWIGIMIASVGVTVFIIAMITLSDSWRAGIPAADKTELVTQGIYKFSRNPAFLGFDLMYIGLLTAFFNPIHLIFVLFAITMLHLQILQEERYLEKSFGELYRKYKESTARYFII